MVDVLAFIRRQIDAGEYVGVWSSWEKTFPARVQWLRSIGNTAPYSYVLRKGREADKGIYMTHTEHSTSGHVTAKELMIEMAKLNIISTSTYWQEVTGVPPPPLLSCLLQVPDSPWCVSVDPGAWPGIVSIRHNKVRSNCNPLRILWEYVKDVDAMTVYLEAGRAPPTPNTVVPWVPPAVVATVSKSQKYTPDNSDSDSGSETDTGNESSSESDAEYDDFHRVPPHAPSVVAFTPPPPPPPPKSAFTGRGGGV